MLKSGRTCCPGVQRGKNMAVSSLRTIAGLGLFTTTMLCSSGAAFAQTGQAPAAQPAQAAGSDEQEVIVTAQKRSENLQNVPISIQALGAVALQEQNVSNFQDYTRLLPSIS